MHTATQVFAHRAPATRTKARWQPYNSTPALSTMPSRSPAITCLNTPSTNVQSPSQPPTSLNDFNRFRQSLTTPPTQTPTPKDTAQPNLSKHKFAAGLVDQAVKTLCDIWHPQNIPRVFIPPSTSSPTQPSLIPDQFSASQRLETPNQTTILSHVAPDAISHQASSKQILLSSGTEIDVEAAMVPLRSFVHEVLRRSRTSGNVLQTALCYLEAIRRKVPELLHQDDLGSHAHFEPESRIMPATEAELAQDAEFSALESASSGDSVDEGIKTIRVDDGSAEESGFEQINADTDNWSVTAELSVPSTCASHLPSPLLCPRRTFLASLILASKFSQDKCYSNRAWAKLSGLPPREIGRCERALGQALDWRLWVGKKPVNPPSTPMVVIRSQSEGSVLTPTSTREVFLQAEGSRARAQFLQSIQPSPSPLKRLQRSSTLPTEAFIGHKPATTDSHTSCSEAIYSDNQEMSIYDERQVKEYPEEHSQMATIVFTQSPRTEVPSGSPDIPSLTSSPSSAGSRTVQMTNFGDNFTYPASQALLDCLTLGLTSSTHNGSINSVSTMKGGLYTSNGTQKLCNTVTVVGTDSDPCMIHAGHCTWHAEDGYSLPDSIGVC